MPLVFSSCDLCRKSDYFEKSQKLNSIDNGGVGVVPNHGNALIKVSVVILVIQYTCILVALP